MPNIVTYLSKEEHSLFTDTMEKLQHPTANTESKFARHCIVTAIKAFNHQVQ